MAQLAVPTDNQEATDIREVVPVNEMVKRFRYEEVKGDKDGYVTAEII